MLETREASEGGGRLDIIGKGFCTAAFIQPRITLTVAYCLFDTDSILMAANRFTFEAGVCAGRAAASRSITRFLAHPNYLHDRPSGDTSKMINDIAKLELDQPINDGHIRPYPIAVQPQTGDRIGIVS